MHIIPAKLVAYGSGSAKFSLEDGRELMKRVTSEFSLERVDEQCIEEDLNDLIKLQDLNENAVLHLLRNRFRKDKVYTFVSGILIACNPFRALKIYSQDVMDMYREKSSASTLSPHIFSIANEAYINVTQENMPQSIVISGESGAGKTESIKLILKFLARASAVAGGKDFSVVQDQILAANPLLEAFGNAKTSRNNNSSRFGKLITVNFSGGSINSAKIVNYLLEKCRVVHQQGGEKNFHIFYQVLAGCADDSHFASEIKINNSVNSYNYLSSDDSSRLGHDESESLQQVQQSMEALGISEEWRLQIFKVVSFILRFGNVTFLSSDENADSRAQINDVAEFENLCESAGLKVTEMKKSLLSRSFGVRSIVTCYFSVQQAIDARDAFSKAMYSFLFNWLIRRINCSLGSHHTKSTEWSQFIALLDIFGFENFEANGFEQLLINYCNEKLQMHFNKHVFIMEQEAYAMEGINVGNISFKDNSSVLVTLEEKVSGVLSLIDEEICIPQGTDHNLLNKIISRHKDSESLSRFRSTSKSKSSKPSLSSFVVRHYAGDVLYSSVGFLEKNKDALSPDLIYLGKNSMVPLVAEIFQEYDAQSKQAQPQADDKKTTRRTPVASRSSSSTIVSQFKKQLGDLLFTLNKTSIFFVKCMKTNSRRAGGLFDSAVMMRQLQYSGILEVCRIRQCGYPYRLDFESFYRLYWVLKKDSTDGVSLASGLEEKGLYTAADYRIGNCMVFFKYQVGRMLECSRSEFIDSASRVCQSFMKLCLAKCRLKKIGQVVKDLRGAIERPHGPTLEDAIATASRCLPPHGHYSDLLSEAKRLLISINEEEEAISKGLLCAMEAMDISAMEAAISRAKSCGSTKAKSLLHMCEKSLDEYRQLERENSQVKQSTEHVTVPKPPPPAPPEGKQKKRRKRRKSSRKLPSDTNESTAAKAMEGESSSEPSKEEEELRRYLQKRMDTLEVAQHASHKANPSKGKHKNKPKNQKADDNVCDRPVDRSNEKSVKEYLDKRMNHLRRDPGKSHQQVPMPPVKEEVPKGISESKTKNVTSSCISNSKKSRGGAGKNSKESPFEIKTPSSSMKAHHSSSGSSGSGPGSHVGGNENGDGYVRGSAWGTPSAIRAAQGKDSGHAEQSQRSPQSTERVRDMAEYFDRSARTTPVETSNAPSKKEADGPSLEAASSASKAKANRRSTILQRQLSSQEFDVAADLDRMISDLSEASISAAGILQEDITPLERMLKKISGQKNSSAKDIADLLMAQQELIRAKKQLVLQSSLDKVSESTPLWKLKNLVHQACQLGMENYHGCRRLKKKLDASK